MSKLSAKEINWLYPVTGFYYHDQGIIVKRQARLLNEHLGSNPENKRDKVKSLSQRSLHRLAFLVATSSSEFLSLMTLTYGQKWPKDGKIVRGHRNAFLTWLRRHLDKPDYVWFLEFQKRGAPHLHILLSVKTLPDAGQKKVGSAWVKIASREHPETAKNMLKVHCFTGDEKRRFWSNIRECGGAVRYMRKYVGKEAQKRVPGSYKDVGRFWGTSRNVPTSLDDLTFVSAGEDQVRAILRASGREGVSSWDVLPKYVHT